MSALTLENIDKLYGKVQVMFDVNLDIKEGEFVVFVGPSGCGKSTLLRMIAGLEPISAGSLEIGGQRMNDVPASRRGIAMVFQSYALYPHMSVFENMAFSLRIAKLKDADVKERVTEAARILQLEPYLDRLPKALSGGQRQRVAIGRAIVRQPDVFLFDEPLSNLDAELRVQTRIEIAKLKESMPDTTMIYVTHDQVEAMTLADKIVVLRDGRVEQIGSPLELYRKPSNMFVAGFIGSPKMNFVSSKIDKTGNLDAGGAVQLPTDLQDRSVMAGIRPEHLSLCGPDEALFSATVDISEHLGEHVLYYAKTNAGDPLIVKSLTEEDLPSGAIIHLNAHSANMHLFDPTTGLAL